MATKKSDKAVVANDKIEFSVLVSDARRIFDALTCCICREETGYYLNGVCFDNSEDGLLAVATDGHRLGRLKLKRTDEAKLPSFSHIAPAHFVKRLGGLAAHSILKDECTLSIRDGWIHYKDANEGFSAKLIDGTFPDWRRVYPLETAKQKQQVAFNSAYVAQISSAIRRVHGKSAAVAMKIKDGAEPAILHSPTNEIDLSYVLMPMRF